jgi:hypothetical protein
MTADIVLFAACSTGMSVVLTAMLQLLASLPARNGERQILLARITRQRDRV